MQIVVECVLRLSPNSWALLCILPSLPSKLSYVNIHKITKLNANKMSIYLTRQPLSLPLPLLLYPIANTYIDTDKVAI